MHIGKYIDHTLLKPTATSEEIVKLCEEAKQYGLKAVCVPPCWVSLAKAIIKTSPVEICTVIGFPLGYSESASKAYETKLAIEQGATEIDMVLNVSLVKSRQWDKVKADIFSVKNAAGTVLTKVILETGLLSTEELIQAANYALECKVDFLKTSTGFGPRGASVEDVKLLKDLAKGKAQVKASGGIRDYQSAQAMIDAGATRLGTSAGIAIIQGSSSTESY